MVNENDSTDLLIWPRASSGNGDCLTVCGGVDDAADGVGGSNIVDARGECNASGHFFCVRMKL